MLQFSDLVFYYGFINKKGEPVQNPYLAGYILLKRLAVILIQLSGIVAITRSNKKHFSLAPMFSTELT